MLIWVDGGGGREVCTNERVDPAYSICAGREEEDEVADAEDDRDRCGGAGVGPSLSLDAADVAAGAAADDADDDATAALCDTLLMLLLMLLCARVVLVLR